MLTVRSPARCGQEKFPYVMKMRSAGTPAWAVTPCQTFAESSTPRGAHPAWRCGRGARVTKLVQRRAFAAVGLQLEPESERACVRRVERPRGRRARGLTSRSVPCAACARPVCGSGESSTLPRQDVRPDRPGPSAFRAAGRSVGPDRLGSRPRSSHLAPVPRPAYRRAEHGRRLRHQRTAAPVAQPRPGITVIRDYKQPQPGHTVLPRGATVGQPRAFARFRSRARAEGVRRRGART